MIEVDDTPSDEELEQKRVKDEREKEERRISLGIPSIKTHVQNEKVDYVAPPKIKRPRRLHDHQKKWNEDTKTGLMKEYMQKYRAEGKVYETNSPKSKYVKKPKVQ
jgi:hypothetical protein